MNAQTMASFGKPRRPVAALGSIKSGEQLVVERSGTLGCEQRYILNDFLSVDSGQPLFGLVVSQVNFTKKRLRLLQY